MSRPLPLPALNTVVDDTVSVINADGTVASFSAGTAADPSVVVGNIASGEADSGAPVKAGAVCNTPTLPTVTTGERVDLQADARGNLRAKIVGVNSNGADATSNSMVFVQSETTNVAGETGRILGVGGYQFNGTTWDRSRKPNAVSRIPSSANTTNATSAKAAAGNLCNVTGYNSSATVTYLKFYNKASAPTVGTDTPFVTVALAPTATFSIAFDSLYFSTGIAYGLTTDAADAGTTAVAAGAILGLNVAYA